MVLELHVWGPAFGLPSLDPECLAAIAYFTQALDRPDWTIVHSSPSAVPTRRYTPFPARIWASVVLLPAGQWVPNSVPGADALTGHKTRPPAAPHQTTPC